MDGVLLKHLLHLMVLFLPDDGVLFPEVDTDGGRRGWHMNFTVGKVGHPKVLFVMGEHIPAFLQELA